MCVTITKNDADSPLFCLTAIIVNVSLCVACRRLCGPVWSGCRSGRPVLGRLSGGGVRASGRRRDAAVATRLRPSAGGEAGSRQGSAQTAGRQAASDGRVRYRRSATVGSALPPGYDHPLG